MQITVVGLGYVGLPLAMALCNADHTVWGYDTDKDKIKALDRGESYIESVHNSTLQRHLKSHSFFTTSHLFKPYDDETEYDSTDIYFICVPTPYTKARVPDLTHIIAAANDIKGSMKKGAMVVLQSTSYPGTLMDVVVPILNGRSHLDYENGDYDVAFLPERIDPGRKIDYEDIPKIVGVNRDSEWERINDLFYGMTGNPLLRMTSPAAAEMTKLLENTFRAVNIGFVNEMARLCERMNLNIWEIVDAAATKPYGFMPFYPGPGVGGHCIPIDPYYLLHKALEHNRHLRIVEDALESNELMPKHVMDIVYRAAKLKGIDISSEGIILIGSTYKPDVEDERESPLKQLSREENKQLFAFWDKFTPWSREIANLISDFEIAVILINHSGVDYQYIIDSVKLVVDCCGATRGLDEKGRVYLLGRGFGN